jgi:hypothetical protein
VRRPWFSATPVEESFFETAPLRVGEAFDVARPAAQVWAELTEDNPLAWCRILQGIAWTSPRPFEVGTTRTARALGGLLVLHERFFRWEEGRRHSFYVEEASLPLFRRFAEDYLVEPTSEGSCRFTWTIAAEPRPNTRLLLPPNEALARTLLADTRKHYGVGERRAATA